MEGAFPYNGNIFFNILYPASANEFSAYWKQYFLVDAISLLVETISKEKVGESSFKRKSSLLLVDN